MKKIGATLFAVTAILAGACGDDSNSDDNDADSDNDNDQDQDDPDADQDQDDPDADQDDPDSDVTVPDAPPDSGLPAGCDWAELNDVGNDVDDVDRWEITQLEASAGKTFCGSINAGRFDQNLIDRDGYSFSIATQTNMIVRVTGAAAELTGDNTPFLVFIERIADGETFSVFGADPGTPDRLMSFGVLPAGEYIVMVGAAGDAALTTAADYKIELIPDTSTNACGPATGTATFTEARDTANDSTLNDVITPAGTDTTATTDSAEATAHVSLPTTDFLFSGNIADRTVGAQYYDYDTYEFTTGATTTALRLRMNWEVALDPTENYVPDLDYYLYEKNADGTVGDQISVTGATGDPNERSLIKVEPNQAYYLWVGGYDNMEVTDDGFPSAYQVRICGDTYE